MPPRWKSSSSQHIGSAFSFLLDFFKGYEYTWVASGWRKTIKPLQLQKAARSHLHFLARGVVGGRGRKDSFPGWTAYSFLPINQPLATWLFGLMVWNLGSIMRGYLEVSNFPVQVARESLVQDRCLNIFGLLGRFFLRLAAHSRSR